MLFFMRPSRLTGWSFAALLLAACATSPVDTAGQTVSATGPAHVLDDPRTVGDTVIWGGRIIAVENHADHSEIQVASLPLDHADRPRINRETGVRFIISHPGYLEALTYTPGRYVTVLGQVEGVVDRDVGEYVYKHPVLSAEDLHLWPADTSRWQARPRFSIGIGVRL